MENYKGLKIDTKSPPKLDNRQEKICRYLDALNKGFKICNGSKRPSELIIGALSVTQHMSSNPDWMAQAAHSYREIFYSISGVKEMNILLKFKHKLFKLLLKIGISRILKIKKIKSTKKEKIEEALNIFYFKDQSAQIADSLYKIHLAFTKIAHHFSKKSSLKETLVIFNKLNLKVDKNNFPTETDFHNLVDLFENLLIASALDPLEIHKKIDEFIDNKSSNSSYLKLLISLNYDAKKYLFSRANENWLDWLWGNGFLDKIKEKTENSTKYRYSLPELDYLDRMAEVAPEKVTKIMLDKETATQKEKFNPEVIERFLWIIDKLPANQIKLLTAKIKSEGWVKLMKNFRQNGIEYEKMVEKLVAAKENQAILDLAQVLFSIKTPEEMAENKRSFSMDSPFYLSYLSESGIFQALANLDEADAKKALEITTRIMTEIIKLAGHDPVEFFSYADPLPLYDVDIFDLEIGGSRHPRSYREDIKSYVAVMKKLIEKTLGKKCSSDSDAKKLYKYINDLPSCRFSWRLQLFAMAQCSALFKKELGEALNELFKTDKYYEIEGGAEYKRALKVLFPILSDTERRDYVKKVLDYFYDKAQKHPEEDWHKRVGWEILSSIASIGKNSLTEIEKKQCEEYFGNKCNEKYEPKPVVDPVVVSPLTPKPPANLADFTIEQISDKLTGDWTPEKLNEQFKGDNFLSPRGAEGLGDALKEDIKKRTDEYLKNINSFFDREKIHSHYLYSVLRGIEEALRDKLQLNLERIDQILDLFEAIKTEGKKKVFEKKERSHGAWLADWIEVHRVMTDVLLFIVESRAIKEGAHNEYREKIIDIIEYLLLDIKDSPSKEDEKPEYGEPFHIAINSVRGRAYQVFTAFIQSDGEKLISDTKEIFKKVLADDTMAVRFVVGHYLAAFYFRDKDYIKKLFFKIFPKNEADKKDLYLASWEGYLVNTLYDKLFVDLKEYYLYAITLKPEEYTKRKYTKDLDEALAVHLALAFVHLGLKRGDDLFEQFWKEPNIKRHQEFISFVGRDCLSRNQIDDKWLEENVDKNKLIDFWNWTLKHAEPKALSGFGFWINQEKEVLDDKLVAEKMAETLKKSGGDIEWDYALMKRLPVLAEKNGEKALEIIRYYLLDASEQKLNKNDQAPLSYRGEVKQALEVIYKNGDGKIKQKVTGLINTLIEKGSSMFWGLKEVISK